MADRRVIEADAVDLGVTDVLTGDRSRGRRQGLPQRLTTGGMEREKKQEGEQGAAHGLAPCIAVGISALASGLLYLGHPTLEMRVGIEQYIVDCFR